MIKKYNEVKTASKFISICYRFIFIKYTYAYLRGK